MKTGWFKCLVVSMLIAMGSFLYSCGGGGGSSSSSTPAGGSSSPSTTGGVSTVSTAPPPVQKSTEAVLSVSPLEFLKEPLNIEGVVTSVKQVSGPNVSSLTYDQGVLSFVAPAETGKDEVLEFEFDKSDNTSIHYRINMPTLITPAVSAENDPGEGSSTAINSDLSVTAPSLINLNILPANFSNFLIAFSSKTGAKIASLSITLHNGIRAYRITDYFNIDPQSGVVSLKALNKPDFIAKLSDKFMDLLLSGRDSKGLGFSYGIAFYYGSNTINGKIVDQTGSPVTTLSGKAVILRGLSSGLSQSATIADGGTFSFSNVVTDSCSLTLIDPSGQYFGTSLVAIQKGGSTVIFNLAVFAPQLSKTTDRTPLFMEKEVMIQENKSLPVFQKNQPIEQRPMEGAETRLENLEVTATSSVSVSSAVKDQPVTKVKVVEVAQHTLSMKVKVEVTTAEYPSYSSKWDNAYNDSWGYYWECGGAVLYKADTNRVNNTHSNSTTWTWEKDYNVSGLTANKSMQCTLAATAMNVGDSAYPTTVTVSLEPTSGLTINKASYVKDSGLFRDNSKGGTNLYNMSLPVYAATFGFVISNWKMMVEYTPEDADIENVQLDVKYAGGTYLLNDDQPFTIKQKGQLEVEVGERYLLKLQPSGKQLANLAVTLSGKVKGISDKSKPKNVEFGPGVETFTPLFEVRNYFSVPDYSRYSTRDDKIGGDGWARADMLLWLTTGAGDFIKYNDISGEHGWQDSVGKALGAHSAHKGGYEVDARYYDENGKFETTLCGDSATVSGVLVGGYDIRQVVQAAQNEVQQNLAAKPNLDKLVKWIKMNRTLLDTLVADTNVKLVYVGDEPWFWQPLLRGQFENGSSIPGVDWYPWPEEKVIPYYGHESHLHIRFHPK